MKKTAGAKWERILPWLVLAAALAFSIGIYARSGRHNLDADMSSELVLAKLLNDEGRLLTDSWYYSTELRILSPVPFYQLGLMLFDSWHAARMFAVTVVLLAFVASVLYMTRAMGLYQAGLYAAAALVLPLSHYYALLMTFGVFYTPYVSLAFVLIGLTLRLDEAKGRVRRFVLLLLLSFWGGLMGVRLLMQCAAPLALAATLAMIGRARQCESVGEAARTEQGAMFAGAAVVGFSALAGYLINHLVLSRMFDFADYSSSLIKPFSVSAFLKQIESITQYLGLRGDRPMLSLGGAADMAAIAVVILIGAGLWAMLTGRLPCGVRVRFAAIFTACALVLGMLVSSMITGAAGYYMTAFVMAVVSAFVFLEVLPCRLAPLRAAMLLALVLVFGLEARSFVSAEVRTGDANYEEVADWLVENGYTQGFATFWNGNVLTEASDGRLELYVFDNWKEAGLKKWLQRKSHWTQLPEGKVFVFIEGVEWKIDPTILAQEDHLAAELMGGYIYTYDSAEEVMELQRENSALRNASK